MTRIREHFLGDKIVLMLVSYLAQYHYMLTASHCSMHWGLTWPMRHGPCRMGHAQLNLLKTMFTMFTVVYSLLANIVTQSWLVCHIVTPPDTKILDRPVIIFSILHTGNVSLSLRLPVLKFWCQTEVGYIPTMHTIGSALSRSAVILVKLQIFARLFLYKCTFLILLSFFYAAFTKQRTNFLFFLFF